jgi:polyisoprenoid-binding protein YceI
MLSKTLLAIVVFSVAVIAQTNTPRSYPIDNGHSTVGFSVPILNGLSKVRGKFNDFAITLNQDEKDITKSSVVVVIKAASIDTGIDRRDNHLRSVDFFDVEKFPEIKFESNRIEKRGKSFIAHGTLTMHGVAKEIALPFSVTGSNKDATGKKMNVGYSARVTLNRRDFGINWTHQTVPNFVGDNIDVEIDLITRAIEVK